MTQVAFYATIKPPHHPIASGDRLIARNLITALKMAGYEVNLASEFIAYSKREGPTILQARKSQALVEANEIVERLKADPPDIWLTYHPYCKAPDWIGPVVSQALAIPYVTIEAARTGQGFENGGDRWAQWRKEAQAGIAKADLHIAFKPIDRDYLQGLPDNRAPVEMLRPFIDTGPAAQISPAPIPSHWRPGIPRIITVGQMRPGKKLENYKLLAEALTPLQSLHWTLAIIGDGPERPAIEKLFSCIDPTRLQFTGAIAHENVLEHMAASDIFAWPGWQEPIGMVYLEAQMMGLPVAALNSMGVPLSVRHGETGLLAAEDGNPSLSDILSMLISQPALRKDFGQAGPPHIDRNHSLQSASSRLKELLTPLTGSS